MGCLQRKPAAHPDCRESKPVSGSPKPFGPRSFHPDATIFTAVQFPVQRQRDPVGSGSPSATGDLFRSSRWSSRTDTQRAIEDYQVQNKLPVNGQPDQGLNALLG